MTWPQKVEAPPRSGRAPKNRSGLAASELNTSDDTPARTIFQHRRSLVVDPRAFQKKFMGLRVEGQVPWQWVSDGTRLRRHEMAFDNPSEAVRWVAEAMAESEARP